MFDATPVSGSTKDRIMNAAEDIVVGEGASHLTFDAVAKRTGISKGGILYHYPSKKDLLRAMVARMIDSFDFKRVQIEKTLGKSQSSYAVSYIRASFEENEGDRPSSSAILAAAADDPELLQIVKAHYKKTFEDIRGFGNKASLVAAIIAAVDGIWLLDAFQLCPLRSPERLALKNLLLKLADGDTK